MARTLKEKVIDRLIALYIINRCRTKHNISSVSETKMQKLVFYSEKKLNESKIKALNYRFIKLLFPTYSEELRNDLHELTKLGYLQGQYFKEKKKTQLLLEDFQKVFLDNPEIKELIDSEVDKYAPMETNKLVRKTKRMPWKSRIIEDLKNGTPLVYPLKVTRSRDLFKINEEDLEDLAICLSPKITKDLEKTFDDLRRGRRLTHAEVFGSLCR